MAKKPYLAQTPIQHDGKDYAAGESIELDDKTEAPALLALQAVEPAPETKKPAAK